jgi:quercetin dioxygenase-like cupin family protein
MSDGEGRVFVREMISQTYGLDEFRRKQLAAPRVRSPKDDVSIFGKQGYTEGQDAWWRVGPGDDPFWTQTLQVHLVELPARGAAKGHGHQNEAPFYILEGAGYEIHDGQRYDWTKGDLVLVHTDSVHQHFNPYDEPALTLVIKAKATWLFAGLMQQGSRRPIEREDEFGPREDWSRVWTPGVTGLKKIVGKDDAHWETTPLGRVRVLCGPERPDVRQFSADVFELEIPAGSRSGKHWKMADEIIYVVDGEGYSLHWEVQAEIAEKYHARIATEPTRHEISKGDTLYVPQNTVVQHFAADGSPLFLLSAQNRVFKHLGYDRVHYFQSAPEYAGADAMSAPEPAGILD